MSKTILNITDQVNWLQGSVKEFSNLMDTEFDLNCESIINSSIKDGWFNEAPDLTDQRVLELLEYIQYFKDNLKKVEGEIHREIRKQKPNFYNTNEKIPF
jgi:hypothetical protein